MYWKQKWNLYGNAKQTEITTNFSEEEDKFDIVALKRESEKNTICLGLFNFLIETVSWQLFDGLHQYKYWSINFMHIMWLFNIDINKFMDWSDGKTVKWKNTSAPENMNEKQCWCTKWND